MYTNKLFLLAIFSFTLTLISILVVSSESLSSFNQNSLNDLYLQPVKAQYSVHKDRFSDPEKQRQMKNWSHLNKTNYGKHKDSILDSTLYRLIALFAVVFWVRVILRSSNWNEFKTRLEEDLEDIFLHIIFYLSFTNRPKEMRFDFGETKCPECKHVFHSKEHRLSEYSIEKAIGVGCGIGIFANIWEVYKMWGSAPLIPDIIEFWFKSLFFSCIGGIGIAVFFAYLISAGMVLCPECQSKFGALRYRHIGEK